MPISKTIHFIWVSPDEGGTSEIPADVRGNLTAWRETHPAYEIRIWGKNEIAKELPEIWSLAQKCRFLAMKSDIARLGIIQQFGGFYSDLKNRPMRSFLDELNGKSVALVPEHAPSIPDYKGRIMNSFLACPPKNEFIKECLRRVKSNILTRTGSDVAAATGAGPFAATVRKSQEDGAGDCEILETVWLWGKDGRDRGGRMMRTSASYNGQNMSEHWSKRQSVESLYLD